MGTRYYRRKAGVSKFVEMSESEFFDVLGGWGPDAEMMLDVMTELGDVVRFDGDEYAAYREVSRCEAIRSRFLNEEDLWTSLQ